MGWQLISGIFLGWSLGANDAANVFGTAVSSHMVRWRTAVLLLAAFVLVGSILQGGAGLDTYAKLGGGHDLNQAFLAGLVAALTVTVMTVIGIPVSTSQAIVGGILGISLARIAQGTLTTADIHLAELMKVVVCWVGTPIGAALISITLYPLLRYVFRRLNLHFLTYDAVVRWLLVLAGMYGAYALGANNVANVTGVFYGAGAFGDPTHASAKTIALLVGGISIGIGSLTYGKQVMLTVGSGILPLDAFASFIVVLSEAVTVHIYAALGVPVSTSQAVVGAVLGIGIVRSMRRISFRALGMILIGWVLTPILAGGLAYVIWRIYQG